MNIGLKKEKIHFSLSNLGQTSCQDEARQLREWNKPIGDRPSHITIPEWFHQSVKSFANKHLITNLEHSYSYLDIDKRSDDLAVELLKLKLSPQSKIIIYLPVDVDFIISTLGILKAGHICIPLIAKLGRESMEAILKDSHANLILTKQEVLPNHNKTFLDVKIMYLELIGKEQVKGRVLANKISATKNAIIIYSEIQANNARNIIWGHQNVIGVMSARHQTFKQAERVAFSDHLGVGHVMLTLMQAISTGSCLVVHDSEIGDVTALGKSIENDQISMLTLTTYFYRRLLLSSKNYSLSKLTKVVIFDGCVDESLLKLHQQNCPNTELYSEYSVPETTYTGTIALIYPAKADKSQSINIGIPLANTNVYILGDSNKLVPIGSIGEMVIGGVGVYGGYLNKLNPLSIIKNPYNEKQILFRTGVFAKYSQDGRIEYVGKKEKRVEVLKNIIFLEKIERVLRNHESVADCIIFVSNENKDRLVAYVELKEDSRDDLDNIEKTLIQYLSSILPTYMVPRYWHFVDQLRYNYVGNINVDTLHSLKSNVKIPSSQLIAAIEADMKRILCEVLQQESVNLDDNFFEIGGDSILSIQLVSKARKLGFEISMEQVFDAPNIQAICDFAKNQKNSMDTGNIIKKILCDILHLESVDTNENFFEMGGDSILCMQFVSKARKAGINLNIEQVFDAPTIQAIIDDINKMDLIDKLPERNSKNVKEVFGLSPIQKWFFEQKHLNLNHYNQAVLLETQIPINLQALREAIQTVIDIHSSLKLRFRRGNDDNWQQYYQSYELQGKTNQDVLQIVSLEGIPEQIIKEKYYGIINNAQKSLDIEKGPIFKAVLFHAVGYSKLFIVIHHLVVDTVSWSILLESLEVYYQARLQELSSNLMRKVGRNDYGHWVEQLSGQSCLYKFNAEIPFWKEVLLKARNLGICDYDHMHGENTVDSLAFVTATLTVAETNSLLTEVPKAYNTQINDILLCALCYAYQEWAGKMGMVVDLEVHGRSPIADINVDITETIGWFTNMYPLYLTVNNMHGIEKNLIAVKDVLRSIPNKGIGFGVLYYLANSLPKESIVPIGFNYLGQTDKVIRSNSIFQFSNDFIGDAVDLKNKRSHELEINSEILGGQYRVYVEFSQNHYNRETIDLLLNCYIKWLRAIIVHCCKKEPNLYMVSNFPMANLTQAQIDSEFRLLGEVESIYPLSPMQESLLFHNLAQPNSKAYFIQTAFDIKNKIDIEKFQKAWSIVVQHFSILRTGFKWSGLEQPLQFVLRNVSTEIKYESWRSETKPKERLSHFFKWLETQAFHFDKPPLINIYLIEINTAHYYMVWNFHHIILDGWCTSIIIEKLLEVYQALLDLKSPIISKEFKPYQEYISWLGKQDSQYAKLFWREYLKNCNHTKLQLANYDANTRKQSHKAIEKFLNITLVEDVIQFAKSQKTLLSNVYQLAWGIVLSRYTSLDDVIFGVTVSGRTIDLDGVENMLGLFINTIPQRLQLEHSAKISELLKKMQKEIIKIQRYAYLPLSKIQTLCENSENVSLFNTLFIFEGGQFKRQFLDSELTVEGMPLIIEGISTEEKIEYPLSIIIQSNDEGVSVSFFYDQSEFMETQIEQIATHYQNTLEAIINQENSYIKDIQLMSEKEKQKILECWRGIEKPSVLNNSLIDIFTSSVTLYSQNCAVRDKKQSINYQTLENYSQKIANFLFNLKLDYNTPVCLWCHRDANFLAGLLAIWKVGLCYVPIDPKAPMMKIQKILEQLKNSIILTTKEFENQVFKLTKKKIYFIDEILNNKIIEVDQDIDVNIGQDLDSTAYIIFTSGSTGEPKGVMVPHRAMLNHLHSKISTMNLSQMDVVSQTSSQTFDVSVWQLIAPLMVGGTVDIIDDETLIQPRLFASRIEEDNISVLSTVPSLLSIFLEGLENNIDICEKLNGINWLILIGEVFTSEIYDRWRRLFPKTQIINAYGPTECGDAVTHYHASKMQYPGVLPIHGTIPNMNLYILDKQSDVIPFGVIGELCVSGYGLAKGYYNLPEQTSEAFVDNPFEPDKKLYKTGDLVVGFPDGQLFFIGRKDKQVKINGVRVELLEIESLLKEYEKILDVKLHLYKSDNKSELIAYYISSNGKVIEKSELQSFLKDRITQNMFPKYFVHIQSFPLTVSGKIDYKRLPLPETDVNDVSLEQIEASTPLETQLQGIWKKILGDNTISLTESFVSMGGHSLLAIRLMLQIKSIFNFDLPLTAILKDLNILSLAKMIENNHNFKLSALDVIQPSTIGSNLFFIHPITGLTRAYHVLPTYIKGYGVYAINSPHFTDGSNNFSSIEEMASSYVEIISQTQKNGPYNLIGWSFGGLVALEMAIQLSEKGKFVANVFLIDTYHPKTFLSHNIEEEINVLLDIENVSIKSIEGQKLYQLIKSHDVIMRQYVPKTYSGKVTLMQATAGHFINRGGWQQHGLPDLEVFSIQALHYDMLKEPAVKTVCDSIINNIEMK